MLLQVTRKKPAGGYYTKAGLRALDGGIWLSDMFSKIFSIYRRKTGTSFVKWSCHFKLVFLKLSPVRADTLVGPDEEWAAWVDFSLAWSSSQASMGWSGAGAGVDVGDSRGRDQAGSLDVPDLTR